jgi:WD repeat-containing protein 68
LTRSLDHSTIIYESPQVGLGTMGSSSTTPVARASSTSHSNTGTPLLRIAPCSKDANLLATFHLDSSTVLVLDIRQPGKELYNLIAHTGNINASTPSAMLISSMGAVVTTCPCEWW